jgi:hypothetical protein
MQTQVFWTYLEETWVPRVNHWHATSHWQTLSYNVVSSTCTSPEQDLNSQHKWWLSTDCTGSCSHVGGLLWVLRFPPPMTTMIQWLVSCRWFTLWQTLSYNVVSSTCTSPEQDLNSQHKWWLGTDCTGSCKSNYHTITTTTDLPCY